MQQNITETFENGDLFLMDANRVIGCGFVNNFKPLYAWDLL